MKYFKRSFFKKTSDGWYPCYKIEKDARHSEGLVEVIFTKLIDGMYRVCIWGADDFGMERDFEVYLEAKEIFNTLANKEIITISELKKLEFNRF